MHPASLAALPEKVVLAVTSPPSRSVGRLLLLRWVEGRVGMAMTVVSRAILAHNAWQEITN